MFGERITGAEVTPGRTIPVDSYPLILLNTTLPSSFPVFFQDSREGPNSFPVYSFIFSVLK